MLACPRCHAALRQEAEVLCCSASACGARFESRAGIPYFLPAEQAERFAVAQKAEEQHHVDAWTNLQVGYLPWVKSLKDYREWLESFYRVGFFAFGFPTSFFRGKTVLEIGSGPLGMLECIPH